MKEIEKFLLKEIKEIAPNIKLEDLYTDKITLGCEFVMELMEKWGKRKDEKTCKFFINLSTSDTDSDWKKSQSFF